MILLKKKSKYNKALTVIFVQINQARATETL